MTAYQQVILLLSLFPSIVSAGQGRIGVVGRDTVDFGEHPAEAPRTAVFTLRNIGDDELRIARVRSGCRCSVATTGRDRLAPGEDTQVTLTVAGDSIVGAYEECVFVESSDPWHPLLKLTIKGTAQPLVSVAPAQYVFAGRIATNRPWSKRFVLTPRTNSVTFATPAVTSTYPATAELSILPGDGRRQYAVDVAFTPAAPGEFRCDVTVPFVTPANQAPLMLSATGKAGAELIAIPATVLLTPDEGAIRRQLRLRLLSDFPMEITPAALRLEGDAGVTLESPDNSPSRNMSVTLAFTDEFARHLAAKGRCELRLAMPGAAPARIRCESIGRNTAPAEER